MPLTLPNTAVTDDPGHVGDHNLITTALGTLETDLTALDTSKAPKASPTFTGVPVAPTAAAATNTTQIATTAFVVTEVNSLIASAPGALNTLDELAAALGDDSNYASTITTALGLKAPLANPTFTGVPSAPTAAVDTNTTQVATTAYVVGQGYLKSATAASTYAPLAAPTFTGVPAAPTASPGTNTTQIATTAFVTAALPAAIPGAWTSWTPTVTGYTSLGNGTLDCSYVQIGKTVHYRIKLRIGSTTTIGGAANWTFTMPVAAIAETDQWHGWSMMPHGIGNAYSGDAMGEFLTIYPIFLSGDTSKIFLYKLTPSGAILDANTYSNANTYGNWVNTGYIQVTGTYECV